jgi:hypothetical protein
VLSSGFPQVSTPAASVLVLGSLPGRLSLERGESLCVRVPHVILIPAASSRMLLTTTLVPYNGTDGALDSLGAIDQKP